jgi:hypothetical protein
MQSGHTNFFPEATNQSATRNTYFVRTDGDGSIAGGLTVKGALDVEGSAEILQSLTVGKPQPGDATLDVDGAAHFVDPGLNDPANGGVKVQLPGTAAVDLGIQAGANPGEYVGTLQVSDNAVALALNPALGLPVIVGSVAAPADLEVTDDLLVDGDATVDGVLRTNTALTVLSTAGPGTQFATATAADGSISCSGPLSVFPTASGPNQVGGTQLHKLNSTPGSTDNYLTAGGGKVGFGGIRAPTQQIDVSGNIQATGSLLASGTLKCLQTGPLSSYSGGFYGCGDATIPFGTNSSAFISVPGLTTLMNLGANIMLTYKNPGGAWPAGPADGGGGALTAAPAANGFTIYTQNNVAPALPLLPVTVSWMIVTLG